MKDVNQPKSDLEFKEAGPNLSLNGWLGLPVISRSQRDQQFFFVNGRGVRDQVLFQHRSIAIVYVANRPFAGLFSIEILDPLHPRDGAVALKRLRKPAGIVGERKYVFPRRTNGPKTSVPPLRGYRVSA